MDALSAFLVLNNATRSFYHIVVLDIVVLHILSTPMRRHPPPHILRHHYCNNHHRCCCCYQHALHDLPTRNTSLVDRNEGRRTAFSSSFTDVLLSQLLILVCRHDAAADLLSFATHHPQFLFKINCQQIINVILPLIVGCGTRHPSL